MSCSSRLFHCRRLLQVLVLLWLGLAQAWALERPDTQPRIAVMSAFRPELTLLRDALEQPVTRRINGLEFTSGRLRGQPVVLFLSGISMVNAAMNTQLALDHFNVSHIVFSGIAGGVNPGLDIGDVAVVERWGQYLEVLMARESQEGVYSPPPEKEGIAFPNFGMLFPRSVQLRSAQQPELHRKFWFDVDPEMLAVARSLRGIRLESCDGRGKCLSATPKLVVGGNGVSGAAFVDNARFRTYTYETFQANVLDMESAACAHVAYSNGVPFIAFRSLSDLAGGGTAANEMHTFMDIAADNSARVVLAFLEAWKAQVR